MNNHRLTIHYSGYEVQAYEHWTNEDPKSTGDAVGDPYYMWAPNEGDLGHGYVCAHDDECQEKGAQWWGYMSKGDKLWEAVSNKGGPQDFVWGYSDPENRWN